MFQDFLLHVNKHVYIHTHMGIELKVAEEGRTLSVSVWEGGLLKNSVLHFGLSSSNEGCDMVNSNLG